jgi:hypothetical protein
MAAYFFNIYYAENDLGIFYVFLIIYDGYTNEYTNIPKNPPIFM